MTAKFIIYIVDTILVIWSLESVNINQIFKKNRYYQARIFYFLLAVSLIYLSTNFFWDLFTSIKML